MLPIEYMLLSNYYMGSFRETAPRKTAKESGNSVTVTTLNLNR